MSDNRELIPMNSSNIALSNESLANMDTASPFEQSAEKSTTQFLTNESTAIERSKWTRGARYNLENMPKLRDVPWKAGREATATKLKSDSRPEADLAKTMSTVGQVATEKCLSCLKDVGPFAECIVLDGYYHGACASCKYTSQTTSCSFYQKPLPKKEQVNQIFGAIDNELDGVAASALDGRAGDILDSVAAMKDLVARLKELVG